MLEELDISSLKIEDVRKFKELVEKMPTARTDAQLSKVFEGIDKIVQLIHRFKDLNEGVQTFMLDNVVAPSYPEEFVLRVEKYFEIVLKFMLEQVDGDHFKLIDVIRTIFDPSRLFYEFNQLETDTHKFMVKQLNYLSSDYIAWVKQLKEGDYVDAIKMDKLSQKSCWSRAQIMIRTENDFSIRFLNEKNRFWDRVVSIDSGEIMNYVSRTPNYLELQNLLYKIIQIYDYISEGSLVDSCDTASIWITSTVLQRFEQVNEYGEKVVEYTIGYRMYDENGLMEDEVTKQRFNGWSQQYDETLSAGHPKLALATSMAKKLYKPSSVQTDETIVDDSNDMLYINDYNRQKIYATLRTKQSKGTVLVRLINYFGGLGGFDIILNRIENQQNWLPVQILASYVQALGNIHAQFYRQFALDYIPQFRKALHVNLAKSPDVNIRNMAKEKLDQIMKGAENLVRRAYSLIEKFEFLETLGLDLILICFNSNFLDKKIQALKFLVDVSKGVTAGTSKSLSLKGLLQWITENQIFEQLFNTNCHLELLSRSSDFLKFFMTTEGALTEAHMQSLWDLLILDDEKLRTIIYKVFNDVAIQMKDHQVLYFQSKLVQIRPEEFSLDQVALLYEMNRFQSKNQLLVQSCIEILWGVVKHHSKFEMNEFFSLLSKANEKTYTKKPKELEEKARSLVCDLYKNLESKEDKMKMIEELFQNIAQNQAVSSSLKTLSSLIQSFPIRETETNKCTQAVLVKELVQEKKLMTLLIQNLMFFRDSVREKNIVEKDCPQEFQKMYINKLQERVLLIKTLVRISPKASEVLNLDFLCFIWQSIALQPILLQESDIISKWIRDMVEKERELEFQNTCKQFFIQTFIINDSLAGVLSEDGFDVFQILLYRINEKLGLIKRLFEGTGVISQVNQYGQVTSITSAPADEEKTDKCDFDYLVLAHPDSILGIKFLWEVVNKNKKDSVVERAVQLLTKMSVNPTQELESKQTQIRMEFIDKILQNLNATFDDKPTLSQDEFKLQVTRSLLLLRSLLNETERYGIGSLTSLAGLVKGDYMNLNISNDLSVSNDIPKKLEVKLYSNTTIMDFRQILAKKLKTSWDQIKLIRVNLFNQNRDIHDTDNGKTLADIKLRNGENVMVSKRRTQPIPQVSLTTEDKQFTPALQAIMEMWFNEFSTDGKMSKDQCINFVLKCTGERCSYEDSRIKETYDNYDSDHDGFLSLQDFLTFYLSAALDRPSVVWKNLHAYHYRNDLKKSDEIYDLDLDETSLPRYVLANHPTFYNCMFRLLDTDTDIAQEVWRLLNRLPASQAILQKIVNLQGIKGADNPDWQQIFPMDSPYRLLYTLKIIEYLMADSNDTPNETVEEKAEEDQTKVKKEQKDDKDGQIEEENDESKAMKIPDSIQKSKPNDQKMEVEEVVPLKQTYTITGVENNEQLKKTQGLWRQDFIAYGGFEQLSKVFKSIVALTHKDKTNVINNNILSFILIVMKNYLAAVLKPFMTDIYMVQQYVRSTHYSLEQIQQNLKADIEDQQKLIKKQQSQKMEEEIPASKVQLSEEDKAKQLKVNDIAQILLSVDLQAILAEDDLTKQSTGTGNVTGTGSGARAIKFRVKESEEFLGMVERLRGDLGLKILQTLDLKSLYDDLLYIIQMFMSKDGEIEPEERLIIEYGLCILVSLVLYDKDGCQRDYISDTEGKVIRFLSLGIFTTKNILLRKMFSHYLYLSSRQDVAKYNLKVLLHLFPTQMECSTTKRESSQYFETLCKLFEEFDPNNEGELPLPLRELSVKMMLLIRSHYCTERRASIIFDKTFCGYLQLLESIFKVKPELSKGQEDFAKYLMQACLYEVDPKSKLPEKLPQLLVKDITSKEQTQPLILLDYSPYDYVKCKSSDSRRIVYRILNIIVKNDPLIYQQVVKGVLTEIIKQIPLVNIFNFKPSSDTKSYHGYVGIKNLGSICYMNAMIQQFFMTQSFRYAMLMADDGKQLNQQTFKERDGTEHQVDDNVIHQFQKLFAYLEFSDRPDFNPNKFCFSFKDFQNKPVNVSIQQDAQEFLNMIFDKLENGFKEKGWKQVIEGVYGGKTCNQLICNGCKYIREQDELFYNLSVQVKGVTHINESLKHMIQGEVISDFYCEVCQKKNDINRRQCLSQLPNVLIVHLQRIVYNLDTFQNEKMSNRLEFPNLLNLEPFTREGLALREQSASEEEANLLTDEQKYRLKPKEYYEYKLKGVVIHKGTAQGGHYFSYINHKADKWLEFNDSLIKDCDAKKIASECYGGKESEETGDFWSKNGETSSTNAYILVYERQLKKPIHIDFNTETEKQSVLEKVRFAQTDIVEPIECEGQETLVCDIPYNNFGRFVPQELYKEVWLDNHKFMLEKHSYTEDFFFFIRELMQNIPYPSDYQPIKKADPSKKDEQSPSPILGIYPRYAEVPNDQQSNYIELIENGLYLITEIAARAYENVSIKNFIVPLKNLINLVPTHAYPLLKKFMIDRSKRVFECFISSPDSNVRMTIGNVMLHMINVTIAIHDLTLNLDLLNKPEDPNDHKLACEKDIMNFFIFILQQLNTDVAKNWTKMNSYLDLIRDFCQSGRVQTQFAFDIQLISILIDFFLEKGSPLWAGAPEKNPININFGNKKHTMGNKFSLPAFTPMFQCILYLINLVEPDSYQLAQNDLKCLHYQFFYSKGFTECIDQKTFCQIVFRMCWNNPDLSMVLSQVILDGLDKSNYETVTPYCCGLSTMLGMGDALLGQKIQWIFGFPQPQFVGTSDVCACPYSLSDLSINYKSTIPYEGPTPPNSLLNILYVNRKRYENFTIVLLRVVLAMASINNTIFAYLVSLPPPSYLYAKYVDWIGIYVESYLTESKKYQSYSTGYFNRVENGEECLKLYNAFVEKMETILKQVSIEEQVDSSVSPLSNNLWTSLHPPYILGQTVSSSEISIITLTEGLSMSCQELTIYLTASKPCKEPPTNLVFPQIVLYDNQFIQTTRIDPESSVWKLLLGQRQQEMLAQNKIPTAPPPPPPIEMSLINKSRKQKISQKDGNKMEEEKESKTDTTLRTDGISFSTEVVTVPKVMQTQTGTQCEQGNQGTHLEMELSDFANQLDSIPNVIPKEGDNPQQPRVEEHKQSIAPSSAPIPLPPPLYHLVDVPIIQSNFIRRYTVSNKTEQTIFFRLSFQFADQESLNTHLPQNIFHCVKPKSENQILTLMKIDPQVEWGQYEEVAGCTFKDEKPVEPQKNDSQPQQNKPAVTKKSEEVQVYPSEDTMGYTTYGPNLPNQKNDQTEDLELKACPQCTLLQPAILPFCELCGTNF